MCMKKERGLHMAQQLWHNSHNLLLQRRLQLHRSLWVKTFPGLCIPAHTSFSYITEGVFDTIGNKYLIISASYSGKNLHLLLVRQKHPCHRGHAYAEMLFQGKQVQNYTWIESFLWNNSSIRATRYFKTGVGVCCTTQAYSIYLQHAMSPNKFMVLRMLSLCLTEKLRSEAVLAHPSNVTQTIWILCQMALCVHKTAMHWTELCS